VALLAAMLLVTMFLYVGRASRQLKDVLGRLGFLVLWGPIGLGIVAIVIRDLTKHRRLVG
jgi:hypothetical protein